MRKEICICDVCKTEITASKPLNLEIIIRRDVAKKLGLEDYAHLPRRRLARRKFLRCYIDVCSKECFIKFLEAIKDA